jgi:hypothetical protein
VITTTTDSEEERHRISKTPGITEAFTKPCWKHSKHIFSSNKSLYLFLLPALVAQRQPYSPAHLTNNVIPR